MAAGALIALEGIDGAGTTTQAHRLVDWLQAGGHEAHFTCEPSSGPIGVLIRQVLRGELERKMDPAAIALLFAADRVDHLRAEILPRLRAGCHVITDRYLYSSLAYQSVAHPLAWVREINKLAPAPHLTIYLHVSAETALARRQARGQEQELFEDPVLQQKIAAKYNQIFAMDSADTNADSLPRFSHWKTDPAGSMYSDSAGSGSLDPFGSNGIQPDPPPIQLDPSRSGKLDPCLLVLDGSESVEQLHQQITAHVQKVALNIGS